jgi:hypothetical protein
MTATAAQLRKVFGRSAVWAVTSIARPTSPSDALAAWAERPEAYELAVGVIRTIRRERETQPERPTRYLFCAAHFLTTAPAILAIMSPATRQGPGAGSALCGDCAAGGNLETRMRARLGAQETL